jgi:hypothetical protein
MYSRLLWNISWDAAGEEAAILPNDKNKPVLYKHPCASYYRIVSLRS